MVSVTDVCVAVFASALTSFGFYLTASAVAFLIIVLWKRLRLPWEISGVVVIAASASLSIVYTSGHIELLGNAYIAGSIGALWWLHFSLRQLDRDCKGADAMVQRADGLITIPIIVAGFGYGGAFGLVYTYLTSDETGHSDTFRFVLLGIAVGMLVGVPYLLVWTVSAVLRRRMRH
jgi:hypothetical protein